MSAGRQLIFNAQVLESWQSLITISSHTQTFLVNSRQSHISFILNLCSTDICNMYKNIVELCDESYYVATQQSMSIACHSNVFTFVLVGIGIGIGLGLGLNIKLKDSLFILAYLYIFTIIYNHYGLVPQLTAPHNPHC